MMHVHIYKFRISLQLVRVDQAGHYCTATSMPATRCSLPATSFMESERGTPKLSKTSKRIKISLEYKELEEN